MINNSELSIKGTAALREWCLNNKDQFNFFHKYCSKGLRNDGTRAWEYAFVRSLIPKTYVTNIIDIGGGDGSFGQVFSDTGHNVTVVDSYKGGWGDTKNNIKKMKRLHYVESNCLNLPFKNEYFDIALMISVIEHIPSNTIYYGKRNCLKTEVMMDEDRPIKEQALIEALRVLKKGGKLIITSDMYLDYTDGMNINWEKLIGLTGVLVSEARKKFLDIFIYDSLAHKGRISPICIIIEKKVNNKET